MRKHFLIGLFVLASLQVCASPALAVAPVGGSSAIPDPPIIRLQVPIGGATEITVGGSGITSYLAIVYQWLMRAAVVLSVLMFTIAGFIWITAGGESGQVKKAHEIIKNTIIGLVLAFGSYTILWNTNPKLVQPLNLNIDGIKEETITIEALKVAPPPGAPIPASAAPTTSSSDPSTLLCPPSSDPNMEARKVKNPTTNVWECKMIPINTATKAECEVGDAKPSYTAGNCSTACAAMSTPTMNYAYDPSKTATDKKDASGKTYYCCPCILQLGVPGGSTGTTGGGGGAGYEGQPCVITGITASGPDRKCYDGSTCEVNIVGTYMCKK